MCALVRDDMTDVDRLGMSAASICPNCTPVSPAIWVDTKAPTWSPVKALIWAEVSARKSAVSKARIWAVVKAWI